MRIARAMFWSGIAMLAGLHAGCSCAQSHTLSLDAELADAAGEAREDGARSGDADGARDAFVSRDASSLDAARRDAGHPPRCSYGGGCDSLGDDCPAGEACNLGEAASVCGPAGTIGLGEPCAALYDCAPGTVCVADGTCRRFACSRSDCGPIDWVYLPLGDGTGEPLPNGVGICLPEGPCRPIPNDCPAGQQCEVTAADGSTECFPIGTGVEGGACGLEGGCEAGLGCYSDSGGVAMCLRFCRLAEPGDCVTGMCTSLGGEWGVCM